MKKGDFHNHSIYSDGKLTPMELLKMYKERGFDVIALTDHDTVSACEDALESGKN